MTKGELMGKMRRAGLRLDDAATAASVAVHAMRRDRDALMVRAVECGITVRVVGAILGVTHARVVQVVNAARRDLPAPARTLHATEDR